MNAINSWWIIPARSYAITPAGAGVQNIHWITRPKIILVSVYGAYELIFNMYCRKNVVDSIFISIKRGVMYISHGLKEDCYNINETKVICSRKDLELEVLSEFGKQRVFKIWPQASFPDTNKLLGVCTAVRTIKLWHCMSLH